MHYHENRTTRVERRKSRDSKTRVERLRPRLEKQKRKITLSYLDEAGEWLISRKTRNSNQSKTQNRAKHTSFKPEQKLETELDEIKLEMKLYHLGKKGPEQGH